MKFDSELLARHWWDSGRSAERGPPLRKNSLGPRRPSAPMAGYIAYNEEFQLAICRSCRVGLSSENAIPHMRRQHKQSWKERGKEIKRYIATLTLANRMDLVQPEEPREPIDGIEVKMGWYCGEGGCSTASVSEKYLEDHCRRKHGWCAAKERTWFQCCLQTLLGHPYIKYGTASIVFCAHQ